MAKETGIPEINRYTRIFRGYRDSPRRYGTAEVITFDPSKRAALPVSRGLAVYQPKNIEVSEKPLGIYAQKLRAVADFERGERVKEQLNLIVFYYSQMRYRAIFRDIRAERERADAHKMFGLYSALNYSEQYVRDDGEKFLHPYLISEINNGVRASVNVDPQLLEGDNKFDNVSLNLLVEKYKNEQAILPHVYYLIGNCRFPKSTGLEASRETAGQSIEAYEKAIELSPDFVPAYLKLSAVYEKIGETKESQDMIRKAEEIRRRTIQTAN